ncbi:MAG: chemotaxis protein MotB, partial [Sulfitobacter sp.]
TESQKKGLADYFSPTIAINRISGGGDGAFNGDSIFTEDVLPQSEQGATQKNPTEKDKARGDSGLQATGEDKAAQDFTELTAELMGRGGESTVMENVLRHIITRITDEGLVIELFALPGYPLFHDHVAEPTPLLRDLVDLVASTAQTVTNSVSVEAHVRANPIVRLENPVWELSAQRANRLRLMLEDAKMSSDRMARVTGHADREPIVRNTMSVRNDRVEIILLR